MKAQVIPSGNRFRVRSQYAPALIERFRAIPGREYHADEREWSFPMAPDVVMMVADACGIFRESLPKELQDVLAPVRQAAPEVDLGLLAAHEWALPPYEHQRRNVADAVNRNHDAPLNLRAPFQKVFSILS